MKRLLLLLPLLVTLGSCISPEVKALKQKIKDLETKVDATLEISNGQLEILKTTKTGSREFCLAAAMTKAGNDTLIGAMSELAVAYELDGDQSNALKVKAMVEGKEASRLPDISHICP